MKRSLFFSALLASLLFSACNTSVNTDNKSKPVDASSNNKIRNNIQLQENGLQVEQAFLLLDDGSLIGDDNKVKVGERVLLRLIINGWKDENGNAFPEASEEIMTNDGNILVNQASLFGQQIPNGTPMETAKFLTLYATITKLDKLYDYFVVSFKVWDRMNNHSITGSYKLYI